MNSKNNLSSLLSQLLLLNNNSIESFGKINVGIEDTFDYDVVRNYFSGQKRLNNQM